MACADAPMLRAGSFRCYISRSDGKHPTRYARMSHDDDVHTVSAMTKAKSERAIYWLGYDVGAVSPLIDSSSESGNVTGPHWTWEQR